MFLFIIGGCVREGHIPATENTFWVSFRAAQIKLGVQEQCELKLACDFGRCRAIENQPTCPLPCLPQLTLLGQRGHVFERIANGGEHPTIGGV